MTHASRPATAGDGDARFEVTDAGSVSEGMTVRKSAPFAILDVNSRMEANCLSRSFVPTRCKIVMLTGFGNIATVAAVKAGALDYLQAGRSTPSPPRCAIPATACLLAQGPMSADRVRWNISSGSMSSVAAMSRKQLAGFACTGGPCSGF